VSHDIVVGLVIRMISLGSVAEDVGNESWHSDCLEMIDIMPSCHISSLNHMLVHYLGNTSRNLPRSDVGKTQYSRVTGVILFDHTVVPVHLLNLEFRYCDKLFLCAGNIWLRRLLTS